MARWLISPALATGKTRAITFRMANLIANGVPAEAILAVTFANKAAEEMRNRVSDLLLRAGVPPAQPWLSTFHSLCARLLRREAAVARAARDFAIYDDDDQLAAVKLAMNKLPDRSGRSNAAKRLEPDQLRKEPWANRGAVARRSVRSRRTPDRRYFRAYEKLLPTARPWTLMTCSSGQRVYCANPRPRARNGKLASNTSTWMSIRTPIECNTS